MATVGIFDSGVGGLSVLREIKKLLPKEKYIYYCDNANCPYGGKKPEFIVDRARDITSLLISKGAQAVVVACNTATAVAISTLRSEFDVPFVGMEPAVKPAALETRSGVIGVLATAGTLKASKYLDTRGRFEHSVHIVEHEGKGFVELVENMELEGPNVEETVLRSLAPLTEAGADIVVLGCTHYPFLLPVMKKVTAGSGVSFIDPAPAVAKRLADVLSSNGIASEEDGAGIELLSSGSDMVLRKLFLSL